MQPFRRNQIHWHSAGQVTEKTQIIKVKTNTITKNKIKSNKLLQTPFT